MPLPRSVDSQEIIAPWHPAVKGKIVGGWSGSLTGPDVASGRTSAVGRRSVFAEGERRQ